MKPRTKIEKRVVALRTFLPSITEKQEQYAYDNCFDKLGFRVRKSEVTCMECSEVFHSTKSKDRCPKCGKMLNISDTKKRKSYLKARFAIITMEEEFQVVRFFEVNQYLHKGIYARHLIREIMQHWINDKHKHTVISGLTDKYGNVSSGLELRDSNRSYYWGERRYDISAEVCYPTDASNIRPIYRRNGFDGNLHGISVMSFFKQLMNEPRFETLLKAKQYSLARAKAYGRLGVSWATIRIVLRNQYKIKDWSLWKDYIDALDYFNKDLHNAFYVCPKNLKKAHDVWTKKKQAVIERNRKIREAERERKKAEEEKELQELRYKVADILMQDEDLQISPLVSVDQFTEEGEAMHHCVASYVIRNDCLIFSAKSKEDNHRIATIELSLSDYTVRQCRGVCNADVPERKMIENLIYQNVGAIQQRIAI